MKKGPAILLLFCALLFCLFYWGFDKVPVEIKKAEKSRSLSFEKINIASLISEELEKLSSDQRAYVFSAQAALSQESPDSTRVSVLKNLSGFWFQEDRRAIAAHYAEEIAEMTDDTDSWSIAGTSYVLCSQREESEIADFCRDKAISSFENAISLDPEDIDHKINLALAYVYRPLQDNPMKGILELRQLNEQYPENTSVLVQLARLSIQTNQWENAVKRLNMALELEPNLPSATCLMAEAYRQLNQVDQAELFDSKCKALRG